MSKEKQIEEMAKVLKGMDRLDEARYGFYESYARALYDAGYRKANDLAAEIFAEILKIVSYKYKSVTTDCHFNMRYGHADTPEGMRNLGKAEMLKYIGDKIAELKKKYTEEVMP